MDMAAPSRLSLRPALVLLCVPALAGLLVPGPAGDPRGDRPAQTRLEDWSVDDMVRHLEVRGLGLRAVPTSAGSARASNTFLTRGEIAWHKLPGLMKDPARMGEWQGIVFCERVGNPDTAEKRAENWGSAALQAGPFVFFGDPQLREEIRAALAGLGMPPAGEQTRLPLPWPSPAGDWEGRITPLAGS
jgi:hypothetical protein